MKKILSFMFLGGLLLLGQSSAVWAAATTFTVSATVPAATGVSILVDSINTTSNVFTALAAGTTALSFDPMAFNTTSLVYLPSVYYALNFSVSGGGGEPDVTTTYTEGSNPNGATNGLGHKSSATFAQETTTGETILTSPAKQMLINLSGAHVAFTQLAAGSYLRMYVGVCTGSPTTDPSGCVPFTNSDAAGLYTGSLLVTSVVN